MQMYLIGMLALISIAACSDPKDTPLPRELSKMDSTNPAMEELSADVTELAPNKQNNGR